MDIDHFPILYGPAYLIYKFNTTSNKKLLLISSIYLLVSTTKWHQSFCFFPLSKKFIIYFDILLQNYYFLCSNIEM